MYPGTPWMRILPTRKEIGGYLSPSINQSISLPSSLFHAHTHTHTWMWLSTSLTLPTMQQWDISSDSDFVTDLLGFCESLQHSLSRSLRANALEFCNTSLSLQVVYKWGFIFILTHTNINKWLVRDCGHPCDCIWATRTPQAFSLEKAQ